MKVSAFETRADFHGISIAVRGLADVSIDEVLHHDLASTVGLGDFGIMSVLAGKTRMLNHSLWDIATDIVVLEGRRRRTYRDAVMVFDSIHCLVEFLSTRFVSEGSGELTAIIDRSRGQDGSIDRIRLEQMLALQSSFGELGYKRKRSRLKGCPLAPREAVTNQIRCGDRRKRDRFTFSRLDREITLVCTLPAMLRCGGVDIPRMEYIVFCIEDRLGEHASPDRMRFVYFNGREHRWMQGWGSLDPKTADDFETKGTLHASCDFDLFPSSHLKVRCIVRVPPAGELKKLACEAADLTAANPLLETPALVFDSRRPVRLDGSEPLVLDPKDAAFVVSRMTKGIFIPDGYRRPLPERKLPDEPCFLILAEPGGLP